MRLVRECIIAIFPDVRKNPRQRISSTKERRIFPFFLSFRIVLNVPLADLFTERRELAIRREALLGAKTRMELVVREIHICAKIALLLRDAIV